MQLFFWLFSMLNPRLRDLKLLITLDAGVGIGDEEALFLWLEVSTQERFSPTETM